MSDYIYDIRVFIKDGAKAYAEETVWSAHRAVGVMEGAKIRSLCTRKFNEALKKYADKKEVVVCANFDGRPVMPSPNHTSRSGGLSGVGGVVLRRDGEYDV